LVCLPFRRRSQVRHQVSLLWCFWHFLSTKARYFVVHFLLPLRSLPPLQPLPHHLGNEPFTCKYRPAAFSASTPVESLVSYGVFSLLDGASEGDWTGLAMLHSVEPFSPLCKWWKICTVLRWNDTAELVVSFNNCINYSTCVSVTLLV
jgi:hypothetical protein